MHLLLYFYYYVFNLQHEMRLNEMHIFAVNTTFALGTGEYNIYIVCTERVTRLVKETSAAECVHE